MMESLQDIEMIEGWVEGERKKGGRKMRSLSSREVHLRHMRRIKKWAKFVHFKALMETKTVPMEIQTVLGISKDTFYRWKERPDPPPDVMDKLKEVRERVIEQKKQAIEPKKEDKDVGVWEFVNGKNT